MMKSVILSASLLIIAFVAGDIIVELPDGKIRGSEALSATGRRFYALQKIPFAAPPLGELRFKPPIPPSKWDGILDATDNQVMCYQTKFNSPKETEDCLYLNVYTPDLPGNGTKELLPVMLFIYGGGFAEGDSLRETYGPEFLIDRDVVIVTVNYRLGPFGFLSTQDLVIPGNNGLKDQHMAIKWTHSNIRLFGGDPQKITIFGQSAGSASVTYQLLHKKNEGLFRGAICESGSFLNPWALRRRSREIAFQTAQLIDPTFNKTGNSQLLLEILLKASAEDIDRVSYEIEEIVEDSKLLPEGFAYAPVIEPEHADAFVTEKMYVSLKKGDIIKVPTLVGITSEEGLGFVSSWQSFKSIMAEYDQTPSLLVPADMRIDTQNKKQEMGEEIKAIYLKEGLWQDNLGPSIRFFSDTSFTRSVIKFGELYSRYSTVYFYQFSYDGLLGGLNVTVEGAEKVSHGEELNYIFRHSRADDDNSDLSKFPASDVLVQNRIQQIWTNFARSLNPTPETSELLQNITWPVVTPEDFSYVDIDASLTIKRNPKGETYKEWIQLYSRLGYDDFDTY